MLLNYNDKYCLDNWVWGKFDTFFIQFFAFGNHKLLIFFRIVLSSK